MTNLPRQVNDNNNSDFLIEGNHARLTQSKVAEIVKVSHQSIKNCLCKLFSDNERLSLIEQGFDGGKLNKILGYYATAKRVSVEVREHCVNLLIESSEKGLQNWIDELAGLKQSDLVPQTYKQALLALVAEIEAKEKLEQEKLLLETENKLLEEETERQAEVIDELFDYSSIIRVAKFNGCSEKAFNWRKLKAASQAMELEIKKAPCPRYGEKNLSHHDVWRFVYSEYRFPETTTLVINR